MQRWFSGVEEKLDFVVVLAIDETMSHCNQKAHSSGDGAQQHIPTISNYEGLAQFFSLPIGPFALPLFYNPPLVALLSLSATPV